MVYFHSLFRNVAAALKCILCGIIRFKKNTSNRDIERKVTFYEVKTQHTINKCITLHY